MRLKPFFQFSTALALLAAMGQVVAEPFPSTYAPLPAEPVLITNAVILTGTGERIDGGNILITGGKIEAVSDQAVRNAGSDIQRIYAEGRWVTPGLIDVHSHLGV